MCDRYGDDLRPAEARSNTCLFTSLRFSLISFQIEMKTFVLRLTKCDKNGLLMIELVDHIRRVQDFYDDHVNKSNGQNHEQ